MRFLQFGGMYYSICGISLFKKTWKILIIPLNNVNFQGLPIKLSNWKRKKLFRLRLAQISQNKWKSMYQIFDQLTIQSLFHEMIVKKSHILQLLWNEYTTNILQVPLKVHLNPNKIMLAWFPQLIMISQLSCQNVTNKIFS